MVPPDSRFPSDEPGAIVHPGYPLPGSCQRWPIPCPFLLPLPLTLASLGCAGTVAAVTPLIWVTTLVVDNHD